MLSALRCQQCQGKLVRQPVADGPREEDTTKVHVVREDGWMLMTPFPVAFDKPALGQT